MSKRIDHPVMFGFIMMAAGLLLLIVVAVANA